MEHIVDSKYSEYNILCLGCQVGIKKDACVLIFVYRGLYADQAIDACIFVWNVIDYKRVNWKMKKSDVSIGFKPRTMRIIKTCSVKPYLHSPC